MLFRQTIPNDVARTVAYSIVISRTNHNNLLVVDKSATDNNKRHSCFRGTARRFFLSWNFVNCCTAM